MSAGAKVTIAVVILFTVLLGVYYGFGGLARPGVEPGLQAEPGDAAPVAADPPASRAPELPPARAAEPPRGGLLSESVARSRDEAAGEARPMSAGILGHDVRAPAASAPSVPAATASPPQAGPPSSAPPPSQQRRQFPPVQPLGFNEPRVTGPAPPPTAGAAPPGSEIYIVEEDDSMWTIASDWLGEGARWPEIAKLNPQIDPHRLDVGQKILVPSRGAARPASGGARKGPAGAGWVGNGLEYTVKAGDTLSTIAKTYFGEASKWQAIYDANRQVIGSDPGRLKIGMKLQIPGR